MKIKTLNEFQVNENLLTDITDQQLQHILFQKISKYKKENNYKGEHFYFGNKKWILKDVFSKNRINIFIYMPSSRLRNGDIVVDRYTMKSTDNEYKLRKNSGYEFFKLSEIKTFPVIWLEPDDMELLTNDNIK